QLGQLWRRDSSGDVFLVTKLYSEVFSQIAVLRRAPANGTAEGETIRVKVVRGDAGSTLPGYTFTQDAGDEF
ncbi:MAG TPA: hypothetical protein VE998_07400, partial [Terriglobales bacterium]|nr:hypothetical protein [Terriglobales bacterium]